MTFLHFELAIRAFPRKDSISQLSREMEKVSNRGTLSRNLRKNNRLTIKLKQADLEFPSSFLLPPLPRFDDAGQASRALNESHQQGDQETSTSDLTHSTLRVRMGGRICSRRRRRRDIELNKRGRWILVVLPQVEAWKDSCDEKG